jgi:hypothetical protein
MKVTKLGGGRRLAAIRPEGRVAELPPEGSLSVQHAVGASRAPP